jgi:predicted transcriptional regulator
MKAVLMSIQATHNRNIESGAKKAELRTVAPKLKPPFKVYTYESGFDGRRKVVNEWICDDITTWLMYMGLPAHLSIVACVSNGYIWKYCDKGRKNISEMRISNLKIYDKPKELSEFSNYAYNSEYTVKDGSKYGRVIVNPLKRPPQSWCYVEDLNGN